MASKHMGRDPGNPTVHAEPLEPQIPSISSIISRDSPSMNWNAEIRIVGKTLILVMSIQTGVGNLLHDAVYQVISELLPLICVSVSS